MVKLLLMLLIVLQQPTDYKPFVESEQFTPEQQRTWRKSVVRIVTDSTTSKYASGVLLYHDETDYYVLTAYHAIRDAGKYSIEYFTDDGTEWKPAGTIDRNFLKVYDRRTDVAILTFPIRELPKRGQSTPGGNANEQDGRPIELMTLRLAPPLQRPKKYPFEVLSIGCGYGAPPSCLVERVLSKRAVKRDYGVEEIAFFWKMAQAPVPGRSGGPLIDKKGRIVGICTARQNNEGYFIHIDEILYTLKREGLEKLYKKSQ